jgi:hypothetical protein
MKTNFLKKVLPIGVGMMAVAFVFASQTDSSKNSEDKAISGYILQNNQCTEVSVECDNVQNYPCTYSGLQVFQNKDNQTTCSVQLFHSQDMN